MPMKQRITVEQLQQLSPEQQERLRELWEPRDYDVVVEGKTEYAIEVDLEKQIYMINDSEGLCPPVTKNEVIPLLSIGQCIELLGDGFFTLRLHSNGFDLSFIHKDRLEEVEDSEELIDALWEAVKQIL